MSQPGVPPLPPVPGPPVRGDGSPPSSGVVAGLPRHQPAPEMNASPGDPRDYPVPDYSQVPKKLRWANPAQLTPNYPLRPRYSAIDAVLATVGFVAVQLLFGLILLIIIARFLGGTSSIDDPQTAGPLMFGGLVVTWIALLCIPLLVSKTRGFGTLRKDFGFSIRWIDVLTGFIASIVVRVIGIAVSAIVVLLSGQTDGVEGNLDGLFENVALGWLIVNAGIGVVIMAPILEELFFRGLLLRAIQNRLWLGKWSAQPGGPAPGKVRPATAKRSLLFSSIVAAVISSAIFAAAHLGQIDDPVSLTVQMVTLFVVGMVCAGVTLYFGRLGPAIMTHFFFNGTSIGLLLLLMALGVDVG